MSEHQPKQARFEMCEDCGKHGRIITSGDFAGLEVYSQAYGFFAINSGIDTEVITELEKPELLRQISRSGLPMTDAEADPATIEIVTLWNFAYAESVCGEEDLDPKYMHQIMAEAEEMVSDLKKRLR